MTFSGQRAIVLLLHVGSLNYENAYVFIVFEKQTRICGNKSKGQERFAFVNWESDFISCQVLLKMKNAMTVFPLSPHMNIK